MSDPTGRRLSRAGFHGRWDSVLGPDGAEARFRAWKARVTVAYSVTLSAVLGLVAALTSSNQLAHDTFFALAMAFAVSAAVWLFVWFARTSLAYEQASRYLGLRITARNFPPFQPAAFQKWCTRHQVTLPGIGAEQIGG